MSRQDIVVRLMKPRAPNRVVRDLFDEAAAEITRLRAEKAVQRKLAAEATDRAVAMQATLCLLLQEASKVLRSLPDTGQPEPAELARHIDTLLEDLT